ncbi:hypothetical protein FQR65_LT00487 [Abscondita terminalis]|nr:hypothetical protein FQR65_LT00487 [Abscondita terminalis]
MQKQPIESNGHTHITENERNEKDTQPLHHHQQSITIKETKKISAVKYPTNYGQTLIHFFRANVGPGIFAMGDAFKNSGIVLGIILTPLLGLICLHCEHLLINAAYHVKDSLPKNPDFAVTAEVCFATGSPRLKFLAPYIRGTVNIFLCLTQFGFCCVYFVFISRNIKQVMDYYGFEHSIHLHMAFILLPITLCCLVRNLKYLTPFSALANICILYGITITLYYSCQKPFAEVENLARPEQFPLFFGTALYAFEGIGSVLPLQNEMKNPKLFSRPFGVLNVGLTAIIILFCLLGLFSYLRFGDGVLGSVTLNLPKDELLSQTVKFVIPLGVLLTFALQFYIPIKIIFPYIEKGFGPLKNPTIIEYVVRIFFVLVIFTLAEIVPYLDLFISLVGAFCSTSIALIIPPILEFSTTSKVTIWMTIKNVIIIGIGVLGCVTGSYESIRLIAEAFKKGRS